MDLLDFLHPLGVVRWFHELQSTTVHLELSFSHRVGRFRSMGSPSWSLVCWSCRYMGGVLIRGRDLILFVSGANSTLVRGETLAARWLHEPQPISNQLVGLGFSHRAGRYQPEGSPSSSPGCWNCRDLKGFVIRGWAPILIGGGTTSTLSREATLAAGWLNEP